MATKYTARHADCRTDHSLTAPRGGAFTGTLTKELHVDTIAQAPFLVAAIQYSLIYLLLGGGLFGAVVVYVVAKVLGR
jgi:hypothetical protein